MSAVDHATKTWIRNASDERAAANGCRFDEARGRFVVEWIERYCRLYEGEWAGQPMRLTDWALDCTLRMFGWVRHSAKWGRDIRRFRAASIWVAKKNKKSPTLAGWGLYLWAGDGEQGQKVFLAAKDGQQARKIAGEHAVAMLEKCEDLLAESKINRSTYRISHVPTRSIMEPLSSGNARTQQSKEGLNGSVLIDEVHVVDRDFVRIISRAGISRSEPMQIEVSTAGNNPDGYGKQRFDYARQVEEGTILDPDLFVAIYAAPQDLSAEDLDADPLKYGLLANPAMGHTVDPEEYLRDYQTSKLTIATLLDFMMYRLNIWQRSSNPWLKSGDWEKCKKDYTETDLIGQPCWAGLDLSRTKDLTALVLVFRGEEEGTFLLLAYYWMPEERAKELASLASFQAWAAEGMLTLTPGGAVDFGFIRAKFRELAAKFNIRELAYDPHFAEETTQALADGVTDAEGVEIEAGTGVERFAFAQTDANFASPTADYERLVITGQLHHNGQLVQTWQAGHAHVMVRQNKVKRVVKPTKDSPLTVDGIVAGIMGLSRAMIGETAEVSTCEQW